MFSCLFACFLFVFYDEELTTVEPRYNVPRYNDIPDITMNILCPAKVTVKCMGQKPDIYNDLRYNDIPDITMVI